MADPDPWVRACAAFAGRRHQELKRHMENLAGADPDTLVREAAGAQLGESLETLPSLAMMERIVFLRRVPLFVNLSPADLKHVAQAVGECFGEMAVVSRAARMASLVAEGEVRTLAIDRRRFERILRDRPEVSLAVMGVLSNRLRELHGGEPPEVRS